MGNPKEFITRWTGAVGVAFALDSLLPADWSALDFAWPPLRGLIVFAALGVLQSLLLPKPRTVFAYTFATSLAAVVMIQSGGGVTQPREWVDTLGFAVEGAFLGLLMGVFQFAALQRRLKSYVAWPGVAFIAWGIGRWMQGAFGVLASEFEGNERTALIGAGAALATVVIGGITGVAALKLITGDDDEQSRRVDETGEEHGG